MDNNQEYPFPLYGDPSKEWFRLSELPSLQSNSLRDWLIANFLILEAEVPEVSGVKDGIYLRYYDFWKNGGTVHLLEFNGVDQKSR